MSCELAIAETQKSLLYLCLLWLKFLQQKSDYFLRQTIGFLSVKLNVLRDRHSPDQLCSPLGRFDSARRSSRAAPLASDLGSRNFHGQLNRKPELHPQQLDNGPRRWSGTSHCRRYPKSGRIFKRMTQLPRHKFEHIWSEIRPLLWEPVR